MKRMNEEQRRKAAENIRVAEVLARTVRPPQKMDFDEWRSECYLALLQAVVGHNPAKGSLWTLAKRVVWRRRLALIARSRCKTFGGDRKHFPFQEESHAPTPEAPRYERDEVDRAVGLLKALPPKLRKPVYLRCHGETFSRIGRRVGVSEAEAYRLVKRGTQQLRELDAAGRAAR